MELRGHVNELLSYASAFVLSRNAIGPASRRSRIKTNAEDVGANGSRHQTNQRIRSRFDGLSGLKDLLPGAKRLAPVSENSIPNGQSLSCVQKSRDLPVEWQHLPTKCLVGVLQSAQRSHVSNRCARMHALTSARFLARWPSKPRGPVMLELGLERRSAHACRACCSARLAKYERATLAQRSSF